MRNALSLSDLLPISEEDLRCPFYPSKYGALPYPQNRGRFAIPLDEPAVHADLLVGVSLLLFKEKGPDFFLHTIDNNDREGQ